MEKQKENIIDSLLANAIEYGNNTAFIILEDGEEIERRISYQELESWVRSLASQLSTKGLEGKRALLMYQDTLEFIISFLACQYAGIIAVPVPYLKGSKQIARLHSIIHDARVSAVLCTMFSVDNLKAELGEYLEKNKIEVIPSDVIYSLVYVPIYFRPGYNDIAFIQYTSGSTGNPKGVVVSADNLLHNERLIQSTFGCSRDSVILSWLPFHHDMGLIGNILHTIYVGCTCIIMSPLHFVQAPKKWLKAISKYKATHSGGPNFAYDLCVDKISREEVEGLDLSSWQVAYNGSEPVRHETMQRFAEYFAPAGFSKNVFYPCYGLAEATLLVSGSKPAAQSMSIFIDGELGPGGKITLASIPSSATQLIVSSGQLAPGMEVKIISTTDASECTELQEGEICIAGESITAGYWNRENADVFYELNGKKFLRTGDLGFFYNNELFVHGRHTEMLIIRGRNVYPYDMEQMIAKAHTAIEANGVAACCINSSKEEWVIIAEVKRNAVKDLDAAAVIQAIDRTLTGFFGVTPHDIILTTPLGIPRTTSGKLQRLKCKDHYLQGSFNVLGAGSQLLVAAAGDNASADEVLRNVNYNSVSQYLMSVIASKVGMLQAESVNRKTELTEMGIDSLRATELINSVNRQLGINIDIAKVLQENSFSGLVSMIEHMLWLKNEQTFGEQITI